MDPFAVTPGAALLIIDMQRAIDDPWWAKDGPRNHPGAEAAAPRLIEAWRAGRYCRVATVAEVLAAANR